MEFRERNHNSHAMQKIICDINTRRSRSYNNVDASCVPLLRREPLLGIVSGDNTLTGDLTLTRTLFTVRAVMCRRRGYTRRETLDPRLIPHRSEESRAETIEYSVSPPR